MPPYIEGGTATATASHHRVSVPAVLLAMAPLAFSDSGCAVGEERDPRGIYRGTAPQSPNAGAGGEAELPRGTAGSGGAVVDPDDHTPPAPEDASIGSPDASAPDASKPDAGKPDGGGGGASSQDAGTTGGNGGAGSETCSADPKPGEALEPNSKWRVQVSGTGFAIEPCDAAYATDGDESSRWCNGGAQAGKEWFKLDLGEEQCVSEVALLSNSADFPVAYELFLSTDGKQLKSVAKGKGAVDLKIGFPRQRARHIEVRQTGVSTNGKWWSIYELTVRR